MGSATPLKLNLASNAALDRRSFVRGLGAGQSGWCPLRGSVLARPSLGRAGAPKRRALAAGAPARTPSLLPGSNSNNPRPPQAAAFVGEGSSLATVRAGELEPKTGGESKPPPRGRATAWSFLSRTATPLRRRSRRKGGAGVLVGALQSEREEETRDRAERGSAVRGSDQASVALKRTPTPTDRAMDSRSNRLKAEN